MVLGSRRSAGFLAHRLLFLMMVGLHEGARNQKDHFCSCPIPLPSHLHNVTCGFCPFKRVLCLQLSTGALLLGLDSSHPLRSPTELHKSKLPGRNLQCVPWFRWQRGLMIWSSTARPLPERWLGSHCSVFPIRYAIPLVVHASRT